MQDAELQRITVDRTITIMVAGMGMRQVAGMVTSTGMVTIRITIKATIKATAAVTGMGTGPVVGGAGRSGGCCGWSGRIGTTRRSRSTPHSKGVRRASAQSSSAWPASA